MQNLEAIDHHKKDNIEQFTSSHVHDYHISWTNYHRFIIFFSDLEELPTDAFFGLSKLKQIQVSNAKIGTLAKTVFNGQRGLKKLGLNNNNITNIVRGTFDFGQNLEHLGR